MKRLVLLALTIALLAAPASAIASWGPRQTLDTTSSDFPDDVALAGNSRGDAVAAWDGARGIAVAFARRGKRFGHFRYAPRSRAGTSPQVGIDEQGNAIVLWSYFDNTFPADPDASYEGCCFGVQLTVRNARTGRFGARQTLAPKGHTLDPPAFDIDHGRIGIAWDQVLGSGVFARFGRKGQRLGHQVHLKRGQSAVDLALLKSGPAITYIGRSAHRARLREFRVRRGRAVRDRSVSPSFSGNAEYDVATNAHGQQVAAWTPADGRTRRAPVYAGVRAADGRFHMRLVSWHPPNAPDFGPRLAIAPSGAALVAWTTYEGEVFTAGRRPGKRFGLARQFNKALRNGDVEDLQIAVDSLGRSVLGWTQSTRRTNPHALGAFRSAGGRKLQPRNLGRADHTGNQGTAAFDARGRARLIWQRGATVKVTRARFP